MNVTHVEWTWHSVGQGHGSTPCVPIRPTGVDSQTYQSETFDYGSR